MFAGTVTEKCFPRKHDTPEKCRILFIFEISHLLSGRKSKQKRKALNFLRRCL